MRETVIDELVIHSYVDKWVSRQAYHRMLILAFCQAAPVTATCSFLEFSADLPDSPDSAEVVSSIAAPTPPSTCGRGQDESNQQKITKYYDTCA